MNGTETKKASRFTDTLKAIIIKEGEECVTIAVICRKVGISQAALFIGKEICGSDASEMK